MSYVYVISSWTPPLKIGISNNPQKRLRQIQYDCDPRLHICAIFRFDYDCSAIESRTHRMLRDFSAGGEWFDVRPSVAYEAIRQAAFEVAMENTSAWISKHYHSQIPERQQRYRKIIQREIQRRGIVGSALAFQHLGPRL